MNGEFNDLDLSGHQTVLDHDGGVDWGTIPMEKPFSLSHDWPLLPENLHQLVQGFDVVGIHCGSPGHIVGVVYPHGIEECQHHLLGLAGLDLGLDGARLALWQPLL